MPFLKVLYLQTLNFRNPDGLEEKPICYIDSQNYDVCSIPTCNERVIKDTSSPDLRKVCDEAFPEGREGDEILNTCPSEQFQCEPGECIYSQFVCDGEPDCSNGRDETNCLKYTSLYMVRHNFNQLLNQF